MDAFERLTAPAACLARHNIDTDQIIPKQFLKTLTRKGLGKALFYEWRYLEDGTPNREFVLNTPAGRATKILITGDNFGCGSSREHAPWALLDFGIKCVIATGFADIFYNNCFKNGVLPIVLAQDDVAALMEDAQGGDNMRLTVDLEAQTITRPDGTSISFDIDAFLKHNLLHGIDDIAMTEKKSASIDAFEARHLARHAWI